MYPFDDDGDIDDIPYTYGLSAVQIRERMNYAIHGEGDSMVYPFDLADDEDD